MYLFKFVMNNLSNNWININNSPMGTLTADHYDYGLVLISMVERPHIITNTPENLVIISKLRKTGGILYL